MSGIVESVLRELACLERLGSSMYIPSSFMDRRRSHLPRCRRSPGVVRPVRWAPDHQSEVVCMYDHMCSAAKKPEASFLDLRRRQLASLRLRNGGAPLSWRLHRCCVGANFDYKKLASAARAGLIKTS
jgi:hypothetical protein